MRTAAAAVLVKQLALVFYSTNELETLILKNRMTTLLEEKTAAAAVLMKQLPLVLC